MSMIKAIFAALVLTLLVPLAPASAEPDLEGVTWRLHKVQVQRGDAVVVRRVVRLGALLRVRGDEVEVDYGCNGGGGDVEVGDSTLRFSAMISTMMACPGPRGWLERQVGRTLRGTVDVRGTGERLVLVKRSEVATRTLVYRRGR